jgi:hypothetical protein
MHVSYRETNDMWGEFSDCDSCSEAGLPQFGSFTVIAQTGARKVDDHEIYSFTTESRSPTVLPERIDYLEKNRKVLEGQGREQTPVNELHSKVFELNNGRSAFGCLLCDQGADRVGWNIRWEVIH